MSAKEYHQEFVRLIGQVAVIVKSEVAFREIDENECYLKAILTFASGHTLHLAEYVILEASAVTRVKYRYQLLDANKQHVSRWDNAAHYQTIETFPYHRHNAQEGIHDSRPMSPAGAIAASLALIEAGEPHSNSPR